MSQKTKVISSGPELAAKKERGPGSSSQSAEKVDKSEKNKQNHKLEGFKAALPSGYVHINDVEPKTASEAIEDALQGKKENKTISEGAKPDRSGRRVTEDRGNLKRIAGMFPSSVADQIEAIAASSNSSMSKVVVDLASAQLAEVGHEISENDTVVILSLPPDISPDTRRAIQKLAKTIEELAGDDPSP